MNIASDNMKNQNQDFENSGSRAAASSRSAADAPSSILEEGERHVTRTVVKLAWPSILEQFLISMSTLADTAMVGSIGAAATAAVAVNISSVWLINGFITALSVGCSYLIAHAVGSGNARRTRSVTYQSITCALILGLLLFLGLPSPAHLAWGRTGCCPPGAELYAGDRIRPDPSVRGRGSLLHFSVCR